MLPTSQNHPKRTIFIGDIHGCNVEFQKMLDRTNFHKGPDRLLLAGDAFSKGPDPVGVWQTIRGTGAEMVLGNHDARLLEQLQRLKKGKPPKPENPDQKRLLNLFIPLINEFLPWLKKLPLYINNSKFLLVHAGVHPQKGLGGTTRDQFLTIRTWPPIKGIVGPRWHDHYKPKKKLLVFGHDAPGGLVIKRRKKGTPYLIGLDSGCVYGNPLSAYILEEDRILQVENPT